MKRKKVNMEIMNDYAVGIDIGEKESVATYMSPSGDIIEEFTFLKCTILRLEHYRINNIEKEVCKEACL